MSVLVSDRTESKFEAITYSIELHDMLIDLMQRSFGVKDLDQFVRMRYAHGKDATEDFSKYRYLMYNYKTRIDQLASLMTNISEQQILSIRLRCMNMRKEEIIRIQP